MRVILEQIFPLGRFHATPWKVFPYDDPNGEWPPSPWRLVRAVLARSFQLDREVADSTETHAGLREAMVHAFATSEISWQLPSATWRGPGLRQYQPAEFRRVPAAAKLPGMMAYNTTKVLDNFWIVPNSSAPVIWQFDGPDWTSAVLQHLDACLARITYFGRAESITEIRRLPEVGVEPSSLIRSLTQRTDRTVPVLALRSDATLSQLLATTDSDSVAGTTIPPGSRWMFVERPARPKLNPIVHRKPQYKPVSFVQFAIGYNVAPRYKDTVLIAERFRNRVLGCLTRILTGNPNTKWSDVPLEICTRIREFSGKKSDGSPADGHSHAFFFLWGTNDIPSRLCVWRKKEEAFDEAEYRAILDAAKAPLPLNYKDDPWTLTLVPLDSLVPPPPGIDGIKHRGWTSLTPYVPPRHVFDRSGKEKSGCAVQDQLASELSRRGFETSGLSVSVEKYGWVKTHRIEPRQDARTSNDKLGYMVKLAFREAVNGPISLGASCHFGLGLFVPVDGRDGAGGIVQTGPL